MNAQPRKSESSPFERRDPTGDRLPDLAGDVVGGGPVSAAQVAEEPRLDVLEQDGDGPLLARLGSVEDRAEVALLRHASCHRLAVAVGFIAILYPAQSVMSPASSETG